ncbi:MAG: class II fructose-bisphosphate aldolase [Planctomycetia bacterium]|nr:class II fructose-bisphosphate aldolase [Planctomycetia bacterium]
MLVKLNDILKIAEEKKFAIPAFNVYNMETAIAVIHAAEETRSPVIMQSYSRLFSYGTAFYLAPVVLKSAEEAKVPVCFHLDHGADETAVLRALRYGCTGIMFDASSLSLEENIAATKNVVDLCEAVGVPVEGELGHIGTTKEDVSEFVYTEVADAVRFVAETGVVALAIAVGTAHGRYKKAPQVNVSRIAEISAAIPASVVLHGGSGIPDEQVRAAIDAGIRKVNFGTDICYAFLDKVFETSREVFAVDVFMRDAIEAVKQFAVEKIQLLRADGKWQ